MGTIAIGDLHGNRAGLDDVLGQLREKADAHDAVVFLGDYIDRGPDSKGCIDAILAFRAERAADVVCLYGNHEDWLLQTLRDPTAHAWLPTSAGPGSTGEPPQRRPGGVHPRGVDWRLPLSEQTRHTLTLGWDDSGFPQNYRGTRTVVYGHRNNAVLDEHGWPRPRVIGKTFGLDTSRHGVVSAMRLPDLRVFQSARFTRGD